MQSLAVSAEKQDWRRFPSRCLLIWHLCSLDAPTVAIVWAITLERLANVRVQVAEMVVLGLGTWIVYVLDRVLDGAGAQPSGLERARAQEQLRQRHHFHHAHRKILLRLCGLAAVVLALVCCQLSSRLVAFYLILGLPVLVYGLGVHRRLLGRPWLSAAGGWRGKEAAVAILFTAAVDAPAFVRAQPVCRPALLPAASLLALLCWLNCALISHVESVAPRSLRKERQRLIGSGVTLACLAAAVCHCTPDLRARPAALAVMLSCVLLLTLLLGRDAAPGKLRVLADLGLLTPLLLLIPRS